MTEHSAGTRTTTGQSRVPPAGLCLRKHLPPLARLVRDALSPCSTPGAVGLRADVGAGHRESARRRQRLLRARLPAASSRLLLAGRLCGRRGYGALASGGEDEAREPRRGGGGGSPQPKAPSPVGPSRAGPRVPGPPPSGSRSP